MSRVRQSVSVASRSAACAAAVFVVCELVLPATAGAPHLARSLDERAVFVVTTTADSGPGSLRQLIFDAGATPEVDTIRFSIPGPGVHTIRPATPLPELLDPMTIDGTTQPGYAGTPLIEIDCSATSQRSGIVVATTGVVLRGLAVNRADGAGIIVVGGGGNVIEACHIGIDPTGTVARPNVFEGIAIVGSADNVVGGSSAAERNVISGNNSSGITITTSSSGTLVIGNYIGTDASGTAAVPNLGDGLFVEDSVGTVIGGASSGEGNLISGNSSLGIGLFTNVTLSRIQGNVIGETVGGAPLGNGYDGVYVQDASRNLIGGENAGEGNRIAFNGATGVKVLSGDRNTISRNSIDANDWLAIDIGDDQGVSPNDELDVDDGANGLINVPVLTSIDAVSGGAQVRGVYQSAPNTTFRLEFFTSEDCDPFDNGEADVFLDSFDVSTDDEGTAAFDMMVPVAVTPGYSVVANATDPDGNTSELSECAQVRLAWTAPAVAGGPPVNLTITDNPAPLSAEPGVPGAVPLVSSISTGRGSARVGPDREEPGRYRTVTPTSPGAVVGYNVYRSRTQPVQLTQSNLVATSPASKTSMNVPARNGGFYVVTAKYADGTESTGSNEAGTFGSPVIVTVRLQGASKLTVEGSNFSAGATVIVDGLSFTSTAKVKRGGTRIIQKGTLSNGQTIRQLLDSRAIGADGQRASLVGIRNRSGAVQVVLFVEP